MLRELGELAAARQTVERALAINEAVYGPNHPSVAWTLVQLGLAFAGLKDRAAARQALERAMTILAARLGPDHPRTRWASQQLADLASAPE